MRIGIIAEDSSDVAVMRLITIRLLKNVRLDVKKQVGGGCGKVRRKCAAWTMSLVQRGCEGVVVVHDLDRNSEATLRRDLEGKIAPICPVSWIVLIPAGEIEAWLLCDPAAIAKAFREDRPPKVKGLIKNISSPKEHIADLVKRNYGKEYINTIHNERIAEHMNIATLLKTPSFAQYPRWVKKLADKR
jgi:hypothetical protein